MCWRSDASQGAVQVGSGQAVPRTTIRRMQSVGDALPGVSTARDAGSFALKCGARRCALLTSAVGNAFPAQMLLLWLVAIPPNAVAFQIDTEHHACFSGVCGTCVAIEPAWPAQMQMRRHRGCNLLEIRPVTKAMIISQWSVVFATCVDRSYPSHGGTVQ